MITKAKLLAAVLGVSLTVGAGGMGCSSDEPRQVERWATTENTNVKLDWDKVNEAYKTANGPEDLEKKINEIYEGDEVISVSVQDSGDKTQVVTGFFDKDKDGKVSDPEKIFTIKRDLKTGSEAQYQIQGHGPHYGYYASPFFSIASGMLMGAMLSNMFMPSYMPVAYVTNPGRAAQIGQQRSAYRASNPRFSKPSQSGRSYGGGSPVRSSGGGRSGGGGVKFGVARRGRTVERAS